MIMLPGMKYWDMIFLVVLGIYDFGDRVIMVIVLEFSFGFLCWRYFGSFVKSDK